MYYGDWKDQQVAVAEVLGSVAPFRIDNAGESRLYGIESEFGDQLSPQWSMLVVVGARVSYDF